MDIQQAEERALFDLATADTPREIIAAKQKLEVINQLKGK